jgi:membrane protein implicated in regulation of membrane protease activity
VPPARRRVWVGFALFAVLAILALFVLHGPAAGVVSLLAMLVLIGAGVHALRGYDRDTVVHNERTGLSGFFGGWF